jgi:signal transduction histidine kinase/CheY-like chemotaxis protein
MRSPARPEHGTGGRVRLLVGASAVLGTAAGASAAMWLRMDHNALARDVVAGGLFGAAALAGTIGVRMHEQRRWARLADHLARPVVAGYVGGLAAQADAARRFVGADGAAIVWTEDPHGPRVAAVAGDVPDGWATGATVALPDDGGETTVIGAVPLRLGPHRSGALVAWAARPTQRRRRRLARAPRAGSTAIERARLDDAERRSRLGASHARRHLAMLVGASATLARVIDDWEPAFAALAAEIVPAHADYFALDIVGPSGQLERAVGAHVGPALAAASRDPDQSWPDQSWPDWRAHLEPVLLRGTSVMLRDGQDAAPELTALDLQSLAIIPVRGHGAVAGVLSVGTQAPRRGLRPSDVGAYEELASRCAQALERVALYRGTQAAARAAHMSERRLQALFEASPLAIIEVDTSGELHSANRAAVALFRWPPPPAPRLLPPEVAVGFSGLRDRLAAGQAVVADRAQVHWPDGTASSLSVAAAIVPGGGLVCIFTDVTQRELLERELQQKQRMEALGRMAGGVAHDFNNLLTVIVGYSDLLAQRLGRDDPSYADVDAIRVAGQHAAAFTEQLLTISNSRRGEVHHVDLGEAVTTLEPVLRRLAGEDVRVVIDAQPGAGWIAVDEGQLEQVVLNLVVNARDAMPDGGAVTIATSASRTADGRPLVELTVRDTGVGMDTATLERCFDPFFTTKGRTKGTGLGLATVYGIVDHAGGEIVAESAPGAGTTFRATFPAAAAASAGPACAAEPVPPHVGDARTVLLVEDEPEVRAYVRTVLVDAGYDVVDAGGADDAMNMAAALAGSPALLVTDVLMAGMGGPELAEALRADHPGLPVLFVSGYVEDRRREQLLRATPASTFLAKPFTPAALLTAVGRVLETAVTSYDASNR